MLYHALFAKKTLRKEADVGNQTSVALWVPSRACVASVQDEPVMGVLHVFFGNPFYKGVFNFTGIFSFRKTDFRTDSHEVSIDRHGRLTVDHIQNDVRSFTSHAG